MLVDIIIVWWESKTLKYLLYEFNTNLHLLYYNICVLFQTLFKGILDKCIYGKKMIRRPALFEADAEGNLPGTSMYRTGDGSFLSNLLAKPKLVNSYSTIPQT